MLPSTSDKKVIKIITVLDNDTGIIIIYSLEALITILIVSFNGFRRIMCLTVGARETHTFKNSVFRAFSSPVSHASVAM